MKKLLHIIASPRGNDSRTLKISEAFIKALKSKDSEWKIDELNLFKEKLPQITLETVNGKYVLLGGAELSGELKQAWRQIEVVIGRFLSADAYLISSPMWNFSIPYPLKHYIDIILQPKYLFRYTEKGPEGLVKNKKMLVITSRGGDYSSELANKFDLLERYLRTVFEFVGITDLNFINAQPMDARGLKVQTKRIDQAKKKAEKIAKKF